MVELQHQHRPSGVRHVVGNALDPRHCAGWRSQTLSRQRRRQRAAVEIERLHAYAQLAPATVREVRDISDGHVEIDVHRRARAVLLGGHAREESIRNRLRIAGWSQLARQRDEQPPGEHRSHPQGVHAQSHTVHVLDPHALRVFSRHTHTPPQALVSARAIHCRSPALSVPTAFPLVERTVGDPVVRVSLLGNRAHRAVGVDVAGAGAVAQF